jgi:hypothetical protein
MPLLADAIRTSAIESARLHTADDVSVLVERVVGQYTPDTEESYAVSVKRGNARPIAVFDANDLVEALARLRSLGLPGLAPDSDGWQPVDAA